MDRNLALFLIEWAFALPAFILALSLLPMVYPKLRRTKRKATTS